MKLLGFEIIAASVLGLIAFAGRASAQASTACHDVIPGIWLCAEDPEAIFQAMEVHFEDPDDHMLSYGTDLRITSRIGVHDGESVSCLKGVVRATGVPDFVSCRYNDYLVTGLDAIDTFFLIDELPDAEVIGADKQLLTYPWGSSVPVGSRFQGERRLGPYTCWVRLEYDDLHYTDFNAAHSAGYCTAHLVKRFP